MNIEEEFIPGDIIKAKFVRFYTLLHIGFYFDLLKLLTQTFHNQYKQISYGDSQKLYLSVCEEELGVIFAKHSESSNITNKNILYSEDYNKQLRKVETLLLLLKVETYL